MNGSSIPDGVTLTSSFTVTSGNPALPNPFTITLGAIPLSSSNNGLFGVTFSSTGITLDPTETTGFQISLAPDEPDTGWPVICPNWDPKDGAFVLNAYDSVGSRANIFTSDTGYLAQTFGSSNWLIATATPEPSTILLLAIGAISFLGYCWRRRTAR